MAVRRSAWLPRDLGLRVVSGVILAALALGANYAGPMALAVVVALIALAMSWEWGQVVRRQSLDVACWLHGLAVIVAVGLAAYGQSLAALGGAGLAAVLVAAWLRDRSALMSAIGVLYTGLPAIALIWLRGNDVGGAWAVLFVFAIVWTTDSFSYVCGKLIGGARLWPSLSPGKTWAGTVGGVAFAGAAAVIFSYVVPNAGGYLPVTGVVLSVAAQVGDLAESALKRSYGLRHASHLIPGHGGFMDRMDGVVAATLVAAMIALGGQAATPALTLLQGW